jgi:hypothetical protein
VPPTGRAVAPAAVWAPGLLPPCKKSTSPSLQRAQDAGGWKGYAKKGSYAKSSDKAGRTVKWLRGTTRGSQHLGSKGPKAQTLPWKEAVLEHGPHSSHEQ